MSYSKPLIQEKLEELKQQGVKDFYCLPMYPQYAESTSRSVLEELKKWFKKQKEDLKLKSLEFYFNAPSFLEASEKKIQSSLAEVPGTAEHFKDAFYLFSYHGLPERHVKKLYPNHCKNNNSCCTNWSEDNRFCYRAQCLQTTERLAEKLDLKQYALSFQSRLGKQEWLRPYTVDKVKELAEAGVKNLFVIPYAFTIDCLETEEEIEEEIKEAFLEAGGESFYRVPCLNKDFAEVLTEDFLNNFTEVTS